MPEGGQGENERESSKHQCLSSQLPPTKDALGKHTGRANYQAAIWRRALAARPAVPTPHGHGWILWSGSLYIAWMDQLPAPEAILELIHCNCINFKCITDQCSCRANSLRLAQMFVTAMTVKMNLTCRFKYLQKMKRMIVTVNKRKQES